MGCAVACREKGGVGGGVLSARASAAVVYKNGRKKQVRKEGDIGESTLRRATEPQVK